MQKYSVQIKQVINFGGMHALDDVRQQIFKGAITMMAGLLRGSKEISSVTIDDDFSLIIESNSEVENLLTTKFSEVAVIKKL